MSDKKTELAKVNYDVPVRTPGALNNLGQSLLPQIACALPSFLQNQQERFLRMLITQCSKVPKLLDCTPRSLFSALIQIAQLGLEFGDVLGQAYLIPFGKKKQDITEATLIIGYKGYITLAYRSQLVGTITPRFVRAEDKFDMTFGSVQNIFHKPDLSFTSPITGYYTVVRLVNGCTDFEYMSVKQAEEHRDKFAMFLGPDSPWMKNFNEMAAKTPIRRLSKRIPLSAEMTRAAALDERADMGDQDLGADLMLGEGDVTDKSEQLAERLEKAKGSNGSSKHGSRTKGEYIPGVDDPEADPETLFKNKVQLPD